MLLFLCSTDIFRPVHSWERVYFSIWNILTNGWDPDETTRYEPAHLDLQCLQTLALYRCLTCVSNNFQRLCISWLGEQLGAENGFKPELGCGFVGSSHKKILNTRTPRTVFPGAKVIVSPAATYVSNSIQSFTLICFMFMRNNIWSL